MATLAGHTKAAPVAWTRAVSLADFDSKRNGITAVRLGLALTVIVSHAFAIGGFGPEPLVLETHEATSLGFVAVLAFFTLSGFLLGRSRERTPVLAFLRNRAARILPGYWTALLLTVLVAAPLAAVLTRHALTLGELAGYVAPRLVFIPESSATGLAAFDGATVNGSLWTLGVELLCYVLLACIPVRYVRPVVTGELAALALLWIVAPTMRGPDTALLAAFALGVEAWSFRDRVPVSWPLAILALLSVVGALGSGVLLAAVPGIAYLALVSAWLPLHLETDVSYGTYVLAYPVTVLLTLVGAHAWGAVPLIIAAVAVTVPLAWCSWTLVERPALARIGRSRRGCP